MQIYFYIPSMKFSMARVKENPGFVRVISLRRWSVLIGKQNVQFYFVSKSQLHDICNILFIVPRIHMHDDVIQWKHLSRYWPFVWGIHWSPVKSPLKGQWHGALVFSLICAWINGSVNNGEAGDLRCHRANYDVTVMKLGYFGMKYELMQCFNLSTTDLGHTFQWLFVGYVDSCLDIGGISWL